MTAREAWLMRLFMAAPIAEPVLLGVLAAALSRPASVEQLLLIGDALAEGAREAGAYGRTDAAGALATLTAEVRAEAARTRLGIPGHDPAP